ALAARRSAPRRKPVKTSQLALRPVFTLFEVTSPGITCPVLRSTRASPAVKDLPVEAEALRLGSHEPKAERREASALRTPPQARTGGGRDCSARRIASSRVNDGRSWAAAGAAGSARARTTQRTCIYLSRRRRSASRRPMIES